MLSHPPFQFSRELYKEELCIKFPKNFDQNIPHSFENENR